MTEIELKCRHCGAEVMQRKDGSLTLAIKDGGADPDMCSNREDILRYNVHELDADFQLAQLAERLVSYDLDAAIEHLGGNCLGVQVNVEQGMWMITNFDGPWLVGVYRDRNGDDEGVTMTLASDGDTVFAVADRFVEFFTRVREMQP